MKLSWLIIVLMVTVVTVSGCTTAKKTVKAADQWVQDNLW